MLRSTSVFPVSYTHLDVYKRQLYANLVRQSRAALEKEGAGELMTKTISDVDDCVEAVSYTHLDVYKRQSFRCTRKATSNCSNKAAWLRCAPPNGSGITCSTMPSLYRSLSLIHI